MKNFDSALQVMDFNKISNDWLMKLTANTFMLQYLLLLATYGNVSVYRAAQVVWITFAIFSILRFWKYLPTPSVSFITIMASLFVAFGVAIRNIASGVEDDFSSIFKIFSLCLYFWYFDAFRFLGVRFFMSRFLWASVIILFLTFFHFMFFPEIIYGRYLFFGMQPNLGGEIIFSAIVIVCFMNRKYLSLLLGGLAIFLVFMLQARSALIALALLFFLLSSNATGFRRPSIRLISTVFVFGFLAIAMVLMILWGFSTSATDFFVWLSDEVLLLDDPHRGFGSGVSGRDRTWSVALEIFSRSPFFGAFWPASLACRVWVDVFTFTWGTCGRTSLPISK